MIEQIDYNEYSEWLDFIAANLYNEDKVYGMIPDIF